MGDLAHCRPLRTRRVTAMLSVNSPHAVRQQSAILSLDAHVLQEPLPSLMNNDLLFSKLQIPLLRTPFVARQRLIAHLDEALPRANAWQRALTLISAPAGYGKTTLLCHWLSGIAHPVAWLSLDENDNDPTRFLTYLLAALQQIAPDLGSGLGDLLEASALTAAGSTPVDSALTALLNELAAVPEPFVLVLDDYHLVDNGRVHDALAFLLDNRPPQLHLVIATRADPPLPVARLRAQGRLTELHAKDLAFVAGETATFLKDVMELELTAEQILSLAQRTEGWIAGLQLAGLALQGTAQAREIVQPSVADPRPDTVSAFIQAFTGSHRFILDYLTEEVVNGQSEEIQAFLLRTAVLDRLTAPLCDALTGRTDSQQILERLDAANLFIIPLDEERCWYRYHHLFADLLRQRLHREQPSLVPELHGQASSWYEEQRLLPDAVQHALCAENIERTATLVEQSGWDMLMRGELNLLLRWLEAIGPALHDHPWLSIFKSWALTLTGQWESVEPSLPAIGHHSSGSMPADAGQMRGHIAAIRAYAAAALGEPGHAVHLAQQALDFLPESDQAIRSVVTMTLGTARRLTGDLTGAKHTLEEAARSGRAAGNTYLALGALSSLADLLFTEGRLHRSAAAYNEMLQLAVQPSGRPLPAAGMAYFGQGMIDYEWNQLQRAEEHIELAVRLCRQWGNIATLAGSYVMLFRVRQAQGRVGKAGAALLEAARLAQTQVLAPRATSWVTAFQVHWWLAQRDLEAASHWAAHCGLNIDDDISYLRQKEYLALTRVFLSCAEYDKAAALAGHLLEMAQSAGQTGTLIETLLLQTLILQARGEIPQALVLLQSALSLAEPEGYIRTFVDEGRPLARLLRQTVTGGEAAGYAAILLAAFDEQSMPTTTATTALVEPLSERELQVLRLIVAGLSNREIAEELVIAISTVKSHINNIYGKLDVKRRTQAIARSQELGLL